MDWFLYDNGLRHERVNRFSCNYMVANADQRHLLTTASVEVSVKIENEINKNSL